LLFVHSLPEESMHKIFLKVNSQMTFLLHILFTYLFFRNLKENIFPTTLEPTINQY